MYTSRELITSGLASLRSAPFYKKPQLDPETWTYENFSTYRGFPMGGIGSGGFSVGTQGGFSSLRTNNNWMSPVSTVRGAFWGVSVGDGQRRLARVLRRGVRPEYAGLEAVDTVRFRGKLPWFEMAFADPALLEVKLRVEGWSGLCPHDLVDSTLPVAWFRFFVALPEDASGAREVSLAFSWENLIGVGGTGQTGVQVVGQRVRGLNGRVRYRGARARDQRPCAMGDWRGIELFANDEAPLGAHRRSVLGRHLLLAQGSGLDGVDVVDAWDAGGRAAWWGRFAEAGRAAGADRAARRPAGIVAPRLTVQPGQERAVDFVLVWWMPEHTTERDVVAAAGTGKHQGVRVGHVYERAFSDAEALITHATTHGDDIRERSRALERHLEGSTLPGWLNNALVNCGVAAMTNTVVPRDGTLHTLEAMDWRWYFGGLCGTNDQRLAAHPYLATFHTELDHSEVDLFRRLHKQGRVPHGNGNCDLALSTSDVPYGDPQVIKGILREADWPDLGISLVLQLVRHHRVTGKLLDEQTRADLRAVCGWLESKCVDGVPVGGSTYDTYEFPGTFSYTATLWLACLEALLAVSEDEAWSEHLRGLRQRARDRIDAVLWDEAEGVYRSCEGRDTLFLGSMAGDWAARWCGLGGVLPEARVRATLSRQHALLLAGRDGTKGRAAFPEIEVGFDGKPGAPWVMKIFKVFGYAWQVVSYHAAACIQHGLVDEGLEASKILYDRLWFRGWPWSGDLYGNAGAIYMTNGVFWALPQALAGADFDPPRGVLTLDPQLSGDAVIPLCFPGFWAHLHVRERHLEITRVFAEVELAQVVWAGRSVLAEPVVLREGGSVGLGAHGWAKPG